MSYQGATFGHGSEVSAQAQPVQRGEVALWRAVVDRALDDACGHCGGEGRYNQKELIIARAGSWFRNLGIDMRFVCDLADLNPQAVSIRAAEEIRRSALEAPTRKRHKNVRHVRKVPPGPRPKKRRTEPD